MISTNFKISHEHICKRLFTQSGYAARSRETMGVPHSLCDNIAITGDDMRIINEYIATSARTAVSTISRYTSSCSLEICNKDNSNEIDYYQIQFNLPDNFPELNIDQINKEVIDYIVAGSMQQWAMLMKPDEANIYAARTQNHLLQLRDILTVRNRPRTK